jgi:hypothetical protein
MVRKLGIIRLVRVAKPMFPRLAPMTVFVPMVRKLGTQQLVRVAKPIYPRLVPMTVFVRMVQKFGIMLLVVVRLRLLYWVVLIQRRIIIIRWLLAMTVLANLLAPIRVLAMTVFVAMVRSSGTA